MERAFRGVWIPREIWLSEDLGWTEKFLLTEIDSLSKNGECFATNDYFAKFFKISKDRVSKLISDLSKKEYVEVKLIYKPGSKQVEKRVITTIGYRRKQLEGIGENNHTPIGENNYYINSSFINSFINNTTAAEDANAFRFYEQNFGMISPHLSEQIGSWIDDFNNDQSIIIQAMKIALERNSRQWALVQSILKDWHSKGARTIQDCEALQMDFKKARKGGRAYQPKRNSGSDSSGEFEDFSL